MTQNIEISNEPIVVGIKENPEPIIIESLCVGCEKNGQTVLLLTRIPFFKDTLVGSFSCQQCGYRNNEVQFVGQLPAKGISIVFKVTEKSDLNRQVIKSEHACIKFEELGLQIPGSGKAEINTVEGILSNVESNLTDGQQQRKLADYETYLKIQSFIRKIEQYKSGNHLPFTFSLMDPSGNSNIKNPFAPKLDDRLFVTHFTRTKQQIVSMGYSEENAQQQLKNKNETQEVKQESNKEEDIQIKQVDFNKPITQTDFMHQEPSIFEIPCHSCLMPGQMKLCKTNIPHFSDLIIMSFSCDYCGSHSTDTKTSGAVSDKSTTIVLNASGSGDVKRELYKSESCSVKIPQIQLELDYGTLGGAYTTVEGLLEKIKNHMQDLNPYSDSDDDFAVRIRGIIGNLNEMMSGTKQFTLILEDPLSNSFLQNPYHPEQDKHAKVVERERTEDEKDFLGLTEMSV